MELYLNENGKLIKLCEASSEDEAIKFAKEFAVQNFHFHEKGSYMEEQVLSLHLKRRNPGAYNVMDKLRGTPEFIYPTIDLSDVGPTHPGIYIVPWSKGVKLSNGDVFPTRATLLPWKRTTK